jgi:hypothetical protein
VKQSSVPLIALARTFGCWGLAMTGTGIPVDEDKEFIELEPGEGGDDYEYHAPREKPEESIQPWKAKLIFWAIVIGGIAVGTIIFLTFLSLFVYFFIPIVAIIAIWSLIRYFFGSR